MLNSKLKTWARNGDLGLARIATERARSYLTVILQITQWLMTLFIYLKTTNPGTVFLAMLTLVSLSSVYWFYRFMKFDFKVGMSAEYGKTWEINPAYQKLLQELEEIRKSLKKLEYPLVTLEHRDDY